MRGCCPGVRVSVGVGGCSSQSLLRSAVHVHDMQQTYAEMLTRYVNTLLPTAAMLDHLSNAGSTPVCPLSPYLSPAFSCIPATTSNIAVATVTRTVTEHFSP